MNPGVRLGRDQIDATYQVASRRAWPAPAAKTTPGAAAIRDSLTKWCIAMRISPPYSDLSCVVRPVPTGDSLSILVANRGDVKPAADTLALKNTPGVQPGRLPQSGSRPARGELGGGRQRAFQQVLETRRSARASIEAFECWRRELSPPGLQDHVGWPPSMRPLRSPRLDLHGRRLTLCRHGSLTLDLTLRDQFLANLRRVAVLKAERVLPSCLAILPGDHRVLERNAEFGIRNDEEFNSTFRIPR